MLYVSTAYCIHLDTVWYMILDFHLCLLCYHCKFSTDQMCVFWFYAINFPLKCFASYIKIYQLYGQQIFSQTINGMVDTGQIYEALMSIGASVTGDIAAILTCMKLFVPRTLNS